MSAVHYLFVGLLCSFAMVGSAFAQANCASYGTSAKTIATTPYIISGSDNCKLLVITANAGAITLPAPGTSGEIVDGYHLTVFNNTNGTITLTGTVNGVTNPTISKGYASDLYIGNATWYATYTSINSTPSGTVTSVGLSVPASSIFGVSGSPVTGTGTLALTTTGTSGGVPFFSSTSQLSSSAALTANQLVLGGGAGAAPTSLGTAGTATTVLHGNAAGTPSFGAVNLSTDVTGNLPVGNLNSGTSASATTFWRGDGTWATPTGTTTPGSTTGAIQYNNAGSFGGAVITGLVLGNGTSAPTAYGGTSCTNQFTRSLSASGSATCATVSAADVSLANLTATDTTLTFSGAYNGSTARTVGLNLGNNNAWTKGQAVTPVALTISAGSVALDASASNDFTLTANANFTLSNPTNLLAGQTINIWVTQDATGSRTITWGSQYQAAGGTSSLVLSTTAGAKDLISCVSDTTTTLTCALLKAVAH